ncbi:uncharacterized protein CTHT_0042770 [Thermochaetoides thermophila DSM 1495]|uniref:Altered inheritance of mitochondria protein 21 n=1 Tax=Chaetomium thermophilum (strain DSM 1495 / CBS 144.50 / IMI 039719) TaxID=759272 RepID=G0SAM1_CHATD|nr:hypothetical protein CTHT_0042770 [Thermochaetoides thermophila DSM 1495]EGS19793.1 hypothetical protein CTHT_0042770 [Thermochaetoides thermophila DSM 1495]
MSATAAAQPPAIPPRPSRSPEKTPPMIPPRPAKRLQRSISPNPDRFAPSPLNEVPFNKAKELLQAQHAESAPKRHSVELPSLGEEGMEYARLTEELALANEEEPKPEQTRTIASDLQLHAPKPSLPAASAKQRVQTVTRTDSERAAAFGIGKPSSVEGSSPAPGVPTRPSLKKKASSASQLSATSLPEDEQGIPEIGQQVPMYPNAGDVQAPSPALSNKNHHRKGSALGHLPLDTYGLHGHGIIPQNKLEKAYYEKHPELLKKERVPHHYDRPNDFSMSQEDLNKIVRETAVRGTGVGATDYSGTPSEQVAWQALEESVSRSASPRPASPDKQAASLAEVIHVDEPNRRKSVMFSDSESANEEIEHPYTAPILAEDEVAKDPTAVLTKEPAVEPPTIEEPVSRSSSRAPSIRRVTLEPKPEPQEETEEYEPLFKDDDKAKERRPSIQEALKNNHKKQRFPSADIWEDAPSSVFYTAEVSAPELFEGGDDEEKPEPVVKVSPPPEIETPAIVFARQQEELVEKEYQQYGPEGFPAARGSKPPVKEEEKPSGPAVVPARPASRFPSRDVWEDAPESAQLETEVSAPQKEEDEEAEASPVEEAKPELPERPQQPPKPASEKPATPERRPIKPRQVSVNGEDHTKPAIPDKPKPQIPPRPAARPAPAAVPTSGASSEPSAETAAPAPRPKPAVPARPIGSKIAALQAGFMNDLNRRLQLGPQGVLAAKLKEKEKEEQSSGSGSTEEGGEEKVEAKEKAPLSDARKGRARGPQRRAPTSVAAAAAAAAAAAPPPVKEEPEVSFAFSVAKTVFEIDPEDGTLSTADEAVQEEKSAPVEKVEPKPAAESEAKVEETPVPSAEGKSEEKVTEAEPEKKGPEPEPEPESEAKVQTAEEVKDEKKVTESTPGPETKSLATNMAGEPLIEEEIKKGGEEETVKATQD